MSYERSFAALSNPLRRQIFEILSKSETNVEALASTLPVSRPAVSQHLRILNDAGLVVVRTSGTRHYYSVDKDGLADLRNYLDQLWGGVLDAFAQEANRIVQKQS